MSKPRNCLPGPFPQRGKTSKTIPSHWFSLCELGSQSHPSILLEPSGVLFFLGVEVVGLGEGYYPVDFRGFVGPKIINKNLMDINIDALYNIFKKNQGDVNDAMGSKKKNVVVTFDPLDLIVEKTNVSRSKEKAFNQRKFYSKPTNNNLRTSSSSQSTNKKQEFVKTDNKRVEKKDDEKKRDMSRVKCYNCKKEGPFAKDCKKAKKAKKGKDSAYHKEKMLLCKQAEQGVPLQAEQYDWLEDTNEEIQKQLKKSNTTLAQELKECKTILAETSKSLGESISVRDSCLVALQTKQAEFEKYKTFNDRTIDYNKLERKLNEALGQLAHKDTVIKEGLKTKACERSVVKEKHDELTKQSLLTKSHYEGLVKQKTKVITDLKLREERDIEKMLSMKKQLKF
nr:hypothetical protein [Tanacetum cinerariifolium]